MSIIRDFDFPMVGALSIGVPMEEARSSDRSSKEEYSRYGKYRGCFALEEKKFGASYRVIRGERLDEHVWFIDQESFY